MGSGKCIQGEATVPNLLSGQPAEDWYNVDVKYKHNDNSNDNNNDNSNDNNDDNDDNNNSNSINNLYIYIVS